MNNMSPGHNTNSAGGRLHWRSSLFKAFVFFGLAMQAPKFKMVHLHLSLKFEYDPNTTL